MNFYLQYRDRKTSAFRKILRPTQVDDAPPNTLVSINLRCVCQQKIQLLSLKGSISESGNDDSNKKDADEQIVNHTPHDLFVELDELINDEWVEQARWIKYEEAREQGAERWGKPHVSTLSFNSLVNLRQIGETIFSKMTSSLRYIFLSRIYLERGIVLLDLEAKDMANLYSIVTENWVEAGLLDEQQKSEVLSALLQKYANQL